MKRTVEDLLPIIGAVTGAALAVGLHRLGHLRIGASATSLLAAAINVGAIAAGFLATCQSMLLSAGDNKAVKALRKTEHFARLLRFISNSVKLSFLLAGYSALLMVCDFQKDDTIHVLLLEAWVVVAGATGFSYYRSVSIILRVLETSPEQHGDSDSSVAPDAELLPHE